MDIYSMPGAIGNCLRYLRSWNPVFKDDEDCRTAAWNLRKICMDIYPYMFPLAVMLVDKDMWVKMPKVFPYATADLSKAVFIKTVKLFESIPSKTRSVLFIGTSSRGSGRLLTTPFHIGSLAFNNTYEAVATNRVRSMNNALNTAKNLMLAIGGPNVTMDLKGRSKAERYILFNHRK